MQGPPHKPPTVSPDLILKKLLQFRYMFINNATSPPTSTGNAPTLSVSLHGMDDQQNFLPPLVLKDNIQIEDEFHCSPLYLKPYQKLNSAGLPWGLNDKDGTQLIIKATPPSPTTSVFIKLWNYKHDEYQVYENTLNIRVLASTIFPYWSIDGVIPSSLSNHPEKIDAPYPNNFKIFSFPSNGQVALWYWMK